MISHARVALLRRATALVDTAPLQPGIACRHLGQGAEASAQALEPSIAPGSRWHPGPDHTRWRYAHSSPLPGTPEREAEGDAAPGAARSDEQGMEQAVLDAALNHVAHLGWTVAALQEAARELGLSPAVAGSLPRGAAQLVEHFNARCNQLLEQRLRGMAQELAEMRMTQRVATGARMRLEMIIPHIASWPQALALQALPSSLPVTVQQYGEMADVVWRAAGDKSLDFTWYSKRALLTACYAATELFMLTDTSRGYEDTWAALDRRLQDVVSVGKAAGQAGTAASSVAGAASDALGALLGRVMPRPNHS